MFFDTDNLKVTPTTGGVNNVVQVRMEGNGPARAQTLYPLSSFLLQYVETKDGDRYVLRIYNNGNQSEKVIFEHEVGSGRELWYGQGQGLNTT